MIDMGTNTLDIKVRPHRDGVRTLTMDANAQASLPIVDVMLPSGGGDQLAIPQINLSVLGYEPDSLRDSHIRSPSMRAQEFQLCHSRMGQCLFKERSYWKESTRRLQFSGTRIFPKRHICMRSIHIKKEGISRRK